MMVIDCPVCHAPFKEVINEGVLIDVCTECRGVWLDRGELEKLLDIAREKNERYVARWFDDDGYYKSDRTKRKP